jgi:hypothetical protein
MRIKLFAIVFCVIAVFIYSSAWAGREFRTCREMNLQFLLDKIEMSDEFDFEGAKILVLELRHELRVEKMRRERQLVEQNIPVHPRNEEPAVICPECVGDEGTGGN